MVLLAIDWFDPFAVNAHGELEPPGAENREAVAPSMDLGDHATVTRAGGRVVVTRKVPIGCLSVRTVHE
jgi:hypothetical protein